MKHYTEYLQEMNRTYDFSVKLAGCEFNEEMRDKLKNALSIYSVEYIGKAKSLPIQEHSDFPGMGPCECYIIEVSIKYPTISDQLAQIISEKLGIARKAVLVRTLREEEISTVFYEPKKAKDGSVLNNPELDAEPDSQELVGEKRVTGLLKDLISRKYEFAGKLPSSKDPEIKVSTNSPVGSSQNTIPDPTKKGK